MTLGGYAGCGKSFLIAQIAREMRARNKKARFAFAAYTGKASLVLRDKLTAAGALTSDDYCGTLHGLFYKAVTDRGVVVGWKKVNKEEVRYDAMFLDEASMATEEIVRDAQTYGFQILAVGDHGQLPPVTGSFNLMEKPDLRLETVHRQAEGSPIIKVSMLARLEGRIPVGVYGPGVFKTTDATILERLRNPKDGLILCGTNRTRGRINAMMRRRCGHLGAAPEVGELVVNLKNFHADGVYNGMVGLVTKIAETCPGQLKGHSEKNCRHHYDLSVNFAASAVSWRGAALRAQFGAAKTLQELPGLSPSALGGRFDWGYCLTTHKAQGSEAESVVVVEETGWMDEDMKRRWLYTSATRARKNLVLIGS